MDEYTALARQSAENFIRTGKEMPVPQGLPEAFYREKKGVFVTLYASRDGERCLRGCVGTFAPTRPSVAEEIIRSAVLASQEDERFSPVREEELSDLSYEVSLLEPPEEVHFEAELDAKKYGVIVRTEDGRCGLLLPDLEGVDSPLHQIAIAAQKGGIDIAHESFSLWRFAVRKFKE